MKSLEECHNSLMSLWSIQESLLQSYRALFITVQSILFSFAVALAVSVSQLIVFLLILLGMFLMLLWTDVCRSRALDVSFVQWLILIKVEKGETVTTPITVFKKYQDTKTFEGKDIMVEKSFTILKDSPTRKRMEIYLPRVFWFLWFILALYVLCNKYCNAT